MLKKENEKYIILSENFEKRAAAMEWMLDVYAKHPPESIIASNFAEDPDEVITYIVLDKSKLNQPEKKLIKIT